MTTNPPVCDKGGKGPEITCQACIDFIIDYLEGTLPEREKSDFESHLNVCRGCVTYLENYKHTMSLCKHSFECHEKTQPVPEDLVQAILTARKHLHG